MIIAIVLLASSSLRITDSFKVPAAPRSISRLLAAQDVTSSPNSLSDRSAPEYSFIRDELRMYAMKLHTTDQSPREGQQPAQKPVKDWTPTLEDYVHFLTDSLAVYETMELIVNTYPELEIYRNTGLERVQALKDDLQWITNSYNPSLSIPPVGEPGSSYSSFLMNIAKESIPKFLCHYYNYYFAHTAGGMMIGRKMSKLLLEGKRLEFYQWKSNVKELMNATKYKIDAMALTWDDDERQACVKETQSCFQYGGLLNNYIRPKE